MKIERTRAPKTKDAELNKKKKNENKERKGKPFWIRNMENRQHSCGVMGGTLQVELVEQDGWKMENHDFAHECGVSVTSNDLLKKLIIYTKKSFL